MTDQTPSPDTKNENRRSGVGTPRWVKIFGIVALILVLLFLVTGLVTGGHGPQLHSPSGGTTFQAQVAVNENIRSNHS